MQLRKRQFNSLGKKTQQQQQVNGFFKAILYFHQEKSVKFITFLISLSINGGIFNLSLGKCCLTCFIPILGPFLAH